jgi:hypothetical protein
MLTNDNTKVVLKSKNIHEVNSRFANKVTGTPATILRHLSPPPEILQRKGGSYNTPVLFCARRAQYSGGGQSAVTLFKTHVSKCLIDVKLSLQGFLTQSQSCDPYHL